MHNRKCGDGERADLGSGGAVALRAASSANSADPSLSASATSESSAFASSVSSTVARRAPTRLSIADKTVPPLGCPSRRDRSTMFSSIWPIAMSSTADLDRCHAICICAGTIGERVQLVGNGGYDMVGQDALTRVVILPGTSVVPYFFFVSFLVHCPRVNLCAGGLPLTVPTLQPKITQMAALASLPGALPSGAPVASNSLMILFTLTAHRSASASGPFKI